MSPRMNALAFRIWQYAEPLGWDCTATEVADAIRSTPGGVGRVCALKGWAGRLAKSPSNRAPHLVTAGEVGEVLFAGERTGEIIARCRALSDEAAA